MILVSTQDSSLFEVPMISETARLLRENVQKVVVGKDDVINLALAAVLCEGHILIEDVPGIGKTTLARALAVSLGCSFRRIQFTPDLLPSDVTGLSWFNQRNQEFEFRPGPIMSQVVLADEINRATPRTQSALLEAMQERQVTVDGVTRMVPRPFLVMATQNPIELEGTFPLPEAQIDRFLLRISIGYPSEAEEASILDRFRLSDPLPDLQPVATPEQVIALQDLRRQIRVETSLRDYIVKVARATRKNQEVALGASPRATMALFAASQAWAAIHGREYVLPDDVKQIAPHVLTHRMMLSSQAQLRGRQPADLVAGIVDTVPVPVES
jgi:MoxR-like ATPase